MLTFSKKVSLAKNQVEQIQKKKTEYKLLGSYRRSKGLKLFSYNVITKEVLELHITYSNEAHLFHNGKVLDWFDPESLGLLQSVCENSNKGKLKTYSTLNLRQILN